MPLILPELQASLIPAELQTFPYCLNSRYPASLLLLSDKIPVFCLKCNIPNTTLTQNASHTTWTLSISNAAWTLSISNAVWTSSINSSWTSSILPELQVSRCCLNLKYFHNYLNLKCPDYCFPNEISYILFHMQHPNTTLTQNASDIAWTSGISETALTHDILYTFSI